MLISIQHHFIFVANRHTDEFECANVLAPYAEISRAGSALRRCLPWSDIKSEYQFVFARPEHSIGAFFKFGVIREPVDWVHAFYRNRHQTGEPGSDVESQHLDFPNWWERNADQLVPWDQASRLTDWNGTGAMDLVIPYEQRRQVLDAVRGRLSLQPLNWSVVPARSDLDTPLEVPDGLCQRIRDYFADSSAMHAASRQQWDAGSAVGRTLRAQVQELSAVRAATLLDLPVVNIPEEPVRLAGVLLLDPAAGESFRMVVQGALAVESTRANLPSPVYATLYPDHPQAAHAKFVIEGLRMRADSTVIVRLNVGQHEWDWLTLTL